jgi:hypothetical protein
MRVTPDCADNQLSAPCGSLQTPTAPLLALPISVHHTVRSVAQEAYRTLWATEPDRAERWRRVGNMDQVYGVGRPLRTITKDVIAAVYREMVEMSMPGNVIRQHLEDFACLMFWADQHGFVRWGGSSLAISVDD